MTSAVKICNMALSHIGSEARVSSIDPPDGSYEAGVCDNFYDQARTEMLETGNWRFALRRAELAELADNPSDLWAYAYALPSDCLAPKRVLRPGSPITVFTQDTVQFDANDDSSANFTVEGTTLFSNEPEAVLIYVVDVTDTGRFSPSFRGALSYLLGSYLAGPIVKGMEGARLGDALRERAMAAARVSAAASANASHTTHEFMPSSLAVRR
jgi:hypothetical protein